jgi:hypothetical protein
MTAPSRLLKKEIYRQMTALTTAENEDCKRYRYPVTDSKAQSGGRGIALNLLDLGAGRGWVNSTTPRIKTVLDEN